MKNKKIKLLDMYCGAGGCSMGYYLAANDLGIEIEITGVDIEPQPNYPFKFIQGDAIEYLIKNYKKYNKLHASPPCQAFTKATATSRKKGVEYVDLIEVTRNEMIKTGLSGVIENVPQAPIKKDIILRGDMFNLRVLRVRHFELVNWFMMCPIMPQKHGSVKDGDFCSVLGKGSYKMNKNNQLPKFKKDSVRETWKYAMGIDWMKKEKELSNSIPPAYTRYIGCNFLNF